MTFLDVVVYHRNMALEDSAVRIPIAGVPIPSLRERVSSLNSRQCSLQRTASLYNMIINVLARDANMDRV